MTETLTPPLKWHGGKQYLADKIVALMPPHTHYVEPFAGGLAVLLAKDPAGVSEVVNDLDGRLTNFWLTLSCPSGFEILRRNAQATPFSEPIWKECVARLSVPCKTAAPGITCPGCAFAFFVACRQSLAGRMKAFAPLSRTRTRRGMNEQASAWLGAVDGLAAVHARLRGVAILGRDALNVIRGQDGKDTLFYLDPPYLPETRAGGGGEYGAFEMSTMRHFDLIETLAGVKGKFLLSGYRSAMYDDAAGRHGWTRTDFNLPNNAAGGKTKRRMTECVWSNFKPGEPSR